MSPTLEVLDVKAVGEGCEVCAGAPVTALVDVVLEGSSSYGSNSTEIPMSP